MEPNGDRIELKAYAKINLTLEVLARRPDKYHELRSVAQTIDLAHEMVLQPNRPGTLLRLSGYPVPNGDDNLIMAALRQANSRLGLSRDLEIRVAKLIPPGRGLGGGSSDAAAILQALGCLYEGQVSPDNLLSLAAEVGSDVPLFLRGGTVLMSGRGELLRHLEGACLDYSLVVAWPANLIPTEEAYRLLTPQDWSDGACTDALWAHLQGGGVPVSEMLCNCFERPVYAQWPEAKRLAERLADLAGSGAHLTGSGSGLYALTPQAETVAARLRAEGHEAVAARPVPYGATLSCNPDWCETPHV